MEVYGYDREKILQLYNDFKYELKIEVGDFYCLRVNYYEISEEYGFRRETDLFTQFVFAGIGTVEKNAYAFECLRNYFSLNHNDIVITNEELAILAATEVAKFCKNKTDQRHAYYQGEDWRHDREKVDYYGSKGRAESRGYDRYMDSHAGGDYMLLNAIIDEYEKRAKSNSKH